MAGDQELPPLDPYLVAHAAADAEAVAEEFTIELLLAVRAPDRKAAERLGEMAKMQVEKLNAFGRDTRLGRIDNVIVSDIRGEDD